MRKFSPQQVRTERNRRITVWVTSSLNLSPKERRRLTLDLRQLFKHATDNELAEFLWEKLAPKRIVADVSDAKKAIQHFHEMALGWHPAITNGSNERESA